MKIPTLRQTNVAFELVAKTLVRLDGERVTGEERLLTGMQPGPGRILKFVPKG